MATCRYCGKGGIFRSVDGNGLCGDCRRPVLLSITSTKRVIDESLKLAQTGKTLSTRLGRWDIIAEKAEHLVEYERRGIPTITPLPSELITFARGQRRTLLRQGLDDALSAAETRAELAATPSARVNAFAKVVEAVQDARRAADGDRELDAQLEAIEIRARARHREVQLENLVDAARKAQFKGQTSKAVDGYRDVLYELRKDPTSNAREIQALESLIAQLQASDIGPASRAHAAKAADDG